MQCSTSDLVPVSSNARGGSGTVHVHVLLVAACRQQPLSVAPHALHLEPGAVRPRRLALTTPRSMTLRCRGHRHVQLTCSQPQPVVKWPVSRSLAARGDEQYTYDDELVTPARLVTGAFFVASKFSFPSLQMPRPKLVLATTILARLALFLLVAPNYSKSLVSRSMP
jgi:hypothetical protein